MTCGLGHIPSGFSRTSFAASTFAGLSVFGVSDDSMDNTDRSWRGVRIGDRTMWRAGGTHDGLDCMHREPSLAGILVPVLVLARWVLG